MATHRLIALLCACALSAACAGSGALSVTAVATTTPAPTATPASPPTPTPAPTATPEPTATPTPTPSPTAGPSPTPLPTPTATPIPRVLHEQPYEQFATVEGIAMHYPAAVVETIGFHESGHDGSKLWPTDAITSPWTVLGSRERGTHPRSAADVVVAPDIEIRSPATGTVVAASTYVLYCEHSDDLVYIAPDEHPTWQIRIFHVSGVQVQVGDRVEAGVTVLAPRATELPFASQVDEQTAEPSWPHVHIEVVDPNVPDRPTNTPGC